MAVYRKIKFSASKHFVLTSESNDKRPKIIKEDIVNCNIIQAEMLFRLSDSLSWLF